VCVCGGVGREGWEGEIKRKKRKKNAYNF
jgi:hypothetical protein